jgi:hypothetical protein
VAAASWYIFCSQKPRVNPLQPAIINNPPIISNVSVSNLSATSVNVAWTTDRNSDSQVEYGATPAYGNTTAVNTNLVASHSVTISGLTSNSFYHYRVKSKDANGVLAVSEDETFTTLPVSKDYFADRAVISQGTSSGSYQYLNYNDGIYMNVNAVRYGRSYASQWYTQTKVAESKSLVSKITITYDGHYSSKKISQSLYMMDVTTNAWVLVNARSIGTSDTTVVYSTADINRYMSNDGVIYCMVSSSASGSFAGYNDQLKFTVEFKQ